jgi:hypothetical protein
MILAVLLIGMLSTPQPVLDCQLAKDIEEASLTRSIYLGGIFEEISSVVEKVTLATEIDALNQLHTQMIVWREANCEGDIK